MDEHHVYIVECADGSLYTGYAKDVTSRIAKHNSGNGAKYTRNRGPVRLMHSEAYQTKSEALKREHEIKKLTRQQKLALIRRGVNETLYHGYATRQP
ncbi:GIY-YIG nuclease family protein [Salinicoccus sp. ID82-1]|uniref:GIY-YIG nuclease family protein n=1 Tax=Salinicoccus sp. ID82-1 TaxID=2820269 RepID=UPI001F3959D0|nr:GIY-YIG nuclease family protein [Salinicoccus sp. ID82-1]MCG1009478.1 GIY-YIG nuclease family protein [Salinicoccus sp. ID82-1]